jgi:hypothetical protein
MAVGSTSIVIQKEASSDQTFVASNVINILVVVESTTPVIASDKTPGKPELQLFELCLYLNCL